METLSVSSETFKSQVYTVDNAGNYTGLTAQEKCRDRQYLIENRGAKSSVTGPPPMAIRWGS